MAPVNPTTVCAGGMSGALACQERKKCRRFQGYLTLRPDDPRWRQDFTFRLCSESYEWFLPRD